jgi:hypothetical protein
MTYSVIVPTFFRSYIKKVKKETKAVDCAAPLYFWYGQLVDDDELGVLVECCMQGKP